MTVAERLNALYVAAREVGTAEQWAKAAARHARRALASDTLAEDERALWERVERLSALAAETRAALDGEEIALAQATAARLCAAGRGGLA